MREVLKKSPDELMEEVATAIAKAEDKKLLKLYMEAHEAWERWWRSLPWYERAWRRVLDWLEQRWRGVTLGFRGIRRRGRLALAAWRDEEEG